MTFGVHAGEGYPIVGGRLANAPERAFVGLEREYATLSWAEVVAEKVGPTSFSPSRQLDLHGMCLPWTSTSDRAGIVDQAK